MLRWDQVVRGSAEGYRRITAQWPLLLELSSTDLVTAPIHRQGCDLTIELPHERAVYHVMAERQDGSIEAAYVGHS